jgi:hypothetical protein
MAFCGNKTDYAACVKNAADILVCVCKMNF